MTVWNMLLTTPSGKTATILMDESAIAGIIERDLGSLESLRYALAAMFMLEHTEEGEENVVRH